MGEDNLKNILIGFILFTLFATLLILAINSQGALYGKDTTQITGGSMNLGDFNRSMTNSTVTAENLRDRFSNQNIFMTLGAIVISGAFDIFKDMILMVMTPMTLLSGILTNVLHIPSFVTNTLLTILILSLIFAIWRAIRVGD
jgi:hypothetical protein